MVQNVFLIFIGFVLLIKGADFLVNGSVKIAKRLHIPEIIIGLTIVSIGTSMPELIVSVTSALEGHSDMALGNVIGSNICNILLILGLSAVVRPVVFKKETKFIEIPIALGISFVLLLLGNNSGGIERIDGIILVVLFALFIAYTIFMGIRESKEEIEQEGVDSGSCACAAGDSFCAVTYGSIRRWRNTGIFCLGLQDCEVESFDGCCTGTSKGNESLLFPG